MSLNKVQQDRLDKLAKIRALGVDPYGQKFENVQSTADARAKFAAVQPPLPQGEKTADPVRVAGRILLYRDIGKLIFITIQDAAGKIQVALSKRELSETQWELGRLLDLGDLIGVDGPMGLTKTGELTVWGRSLTLLAKSLVAPPEKWHGLTDVELRYRQRYVDLWANAEVAGTFKKRSQIIEHIRRFLAARGFLEVETPMMQAQYGGAAARPFITHHNALDIDLFMRISPELYLKRLLVGGLERVFEINRNFRNEGIDTRHNPEFTMMELYQAYGDYNDMMELTEQMVSSAAKELTWDLMARAVELSPIDQMDGGKRVGVLRMRLQSPFERQLAYDELKSMIDDFQSAKDERWSQSDLYYLAAARNEAGRLVLPFANQVIDFTAPWRRATYADLLREHAGVDMFDIAAVRKAARERGILDAPSPQPSPGGGGGQAEAALADEVVINRLFEATVEPHLNKPDANGVSRPIFVTDYPAALCPLTKRDPKDERIALRFEAYVAGMEIANAYTELNDPEVQEANFRRQLKGEEETMAVMDEDFVNALAVGMPPAGGLGVGIDRLVMLLTNSTSIRDVILFPLMRPGV